MESGRPKRRKTRQQIEEELLATLRQAEHDMHKATGKCLPAARKAYQEALQRFNDFVIRCKTPEEEENQ